MVCKNCGKELAESTKICDGCGTSVNNTEIAPKKKSKTWIILLMPVVIFMVLALLLLAPESDTSNETNLGFTLAEFVDRYNSTVDAHLKQDSTAAELAQVKDILKLDVSQFVKDDEDTYIADKNIMGYLANTANDSDNLHSMTFMFSKGLSDEQTNILLIVAKWVFEAIVPDMGEEYYSQTLSEVIETGELKDDNYIYSWDEYENSYGFLIVPRS